jgi:hypothetical protein
MEHIASNYRRSGGKYCFQLQVIWWILLLPTSDVLVKRTSSKFTRFHGMCCFQLQAFWWDVLLPTSGVSWNVFLPTSGVLVGRIASNFRRFMECIATNLRRFMERIASNFKFFPEDEGRTFMLNIGTLLPDCTAPYVIRRDIYSQRHVKLKHVAGVQTYNSEVYFTSKSIFSIEAQNRTSVYFAACNYTC